MNRSRPLLFALCFFLTGVFLVTSCATRRIPVAVWDLDDVSPSPGVRVDLGEVFALQIIETLSKKETLQVIERQRLLVALEELRLGTTTLVNEETRLKLGKMLAATWMVFGGYQIVGGRLRLDLRLVEVETGKVRKAVQKTTSSSQLQEWMDTVRKAAEEL